MVTPASFGGTSWAAKGTAAKVAKANRSRVLMVFKLIRSGRRRRGRPYLAPLHQASKIGPMWSAVSQRDVQGLGSHPEASACFLKCVLVWKGWARYCGSSTRVVTMSQESLFGSMVR